jgi:Zn ribbon nucleic-acid-binding protein
LFEIRELLIKAKFRSSPEGAKQRVVSPIQGSFYTQRSAQGAWLTTVAFSHLHLFLAPQAENKATFAAGATHPECLSGVIHDAIEHWKLDDSFSARMCRQCFIQHAVKDEMFGTNTLLMKKSQFSPREVSAQHRQTGLATIWRS